MWEITKTIKKGRYLYGVCYEHPKAIKYGYVLLHRLVAENQIKRLLKNDEEVHHRNKNRYDNRPENLQVLTKKEHNKLHGEEKRNEAALGRKHGTLASYRYCKCILCKETHNDYIKEWTKKYQKTHKRISKKGKRIWVEL